MAKLHALPEEKKQNMISWKIALLILLLAAGGVASYFFSNKKPVEKKQEGNVLGTEVSVDSVKKKIEEVSKPYVSDLENASRSIIDSASQTVASLAADSADQAKNYVIDSSVGKLIDQVKNLPSPVQEELKKQICK